eukprot:m.232374 g.232374  ORF g.232374 m.232374 type:complete len:489 (+) comp26060_c0_seq1:7769-9235(+)
MPVFGAVTAGKFSQRTGKQQQRGDTRAANFSVPMSLHPLIAAVSSHENPPSSTSVCSSTESETPSPQIATGDALFARAAWSEALAQALALAPRAIIISPKHSRKVVIDVPTAFSAKSKVLPARSNRGVNKRLLESPPPKKKKVSVARPLAVKPATKSVVPKPATKSKSAAKSAAKTTAKTSAKSATLAVRPVGRPPKVVGKPAKVARPPTKNTAKRSGVPVVASAAPRVLPAAFATADNSACHRSMVQGKMCRGLPHTALPTGFSKFNAPTSQKKFHCGICKKEDEIGDPQGQWHRRDLLCDPEICAVCTDCWKVYTNFTEKVKKEPGYTEFVLIAGKVHEMYPVDVDIFRELALECLRAAFASHYFRRRTGGFQVQKSRNNTIISQFFWSDLLGTSGLNRRCFCGTEAEILTPWPDCSCWVSCFRTHGTEADKSYERVTEFRAEMREQAARSRVEMIRLLSSKYDHRAWAEEIAKELHEIGLAEQVV